LQAILKLFSFSSCYIIGDKKQNIETVYLKKIRLKTWVIIFFLFSLSQNIAKLMIFQMQKRCIVKIGFRNWRF